MGQVPLIIGSGRVARHLAHWLALEGEDFVAWSRREPRALGDAVRDASAILLAISDAAIAPVAREILAARPDARLYHFSGALHVPGVAALHPLMTFVPELYDLQTYRAIHFVGDPGHALQDVFPRLANPSHSLAPELRPYYHAMCVLAGTLPHLLWRKAWRDLPAELGVPSSALAPYFARSLANFLAEPNGSFTGPIARGDRATIALNLAALEGDPFQDIYQSFVTLTERLAAQAHDRRLT